MSNTNTVPETYAEKAGRIAVELLDVLRDVLGPERRLPEPRAGYARYGGHSVTVSDGEGGRVELTACLGADGTIGGYSARLTHGDSAEHLWSAVGPVRVDCSEGPEERPTLAYVLPLIVRLECAERRLEDALATLKAGGAQVERLGSRLVLREPRPWGGQAVATVELDPDNGSLRVHGRDAEPVRETLYRANIF